MCNILNRKIGRSLPLASLLRRFRLRTSLQSKLIWTFLPLLLLMLGIFLLYVNTFVFKPLWEKTVEETQLSAAKVSEQLDGYLDLQNQLSQRLLANKDLLALLDPENPPAYNKLTKARLLKDYMFQALGPTMDIRDMIVYDLEGKELVSYLGMGAPSDLGPIIANPKYFAPLNNSHYFLYKDSHGEMAFIRSINDKDGKIYGYLYIMLDGAYLQKLADGVVGADVYILDPEGTVVLASSEADKEYPKEELVREWSGSGIFTDSTRHHYVAYQSSENNDWTSVVVASKASAFGSVNSVRNLSILMIVSLALFSLVYVYVSARNFVLPIRRLRSQITRMNYSNLNLQADRRLHNNELLLLNEAFGEMLERLQNSIEREKLAVHEEVMARNSALQAQIAPHFIHNSLYLISIASQEGKNDAVSAMCKQLSESLRYIVSSPYQHVSMLEEIEHTKRYLSLVERNYEDDLEWSIELDPSADAIQLPRLVIQPFVENAIEHAFDSTAPPWRIKIAVKLYNGLWAIEIGDNGKGMNAEEIRRMMEKIEQSDHGVQEMKSESLGIGSMGVINTVNRLKLMYRNRVFFNIFTNEDGGTTVQIIASLKRDFY